MCISHRPLRASLFELRPDKSLEAQRSQRRSNIFPLPLRGRQRKSFQLCKAIKPLMSVFCSKQRVAGLKGCGFLLSALVHIPLLFLAGLSGKQKNRTSSLRAQRLCGENEYQNGPPFRGFIKPPLVGVVFDYFDTCYPAKALRSRPSLSAATKALYISKGVTVNT